MKMGNMEVYCGDCGTPLEPRRKRRSGWGKKNFDNDAPFCTKCERFKRKIKGIDPNGDTYLLRGWGWELQTSDVTGEEIE